MTYAFYEVFLHGDWLKTVKRRKPTNAVRVRKNLIKGGMDPAIVVLRVRPADG